MRKICVVALPVLALLILTLAPAPTASALIPCENCGSPSPGYCVGSCPPLPFRTTCAEWIGNGCPTWFASPEVSAKELFLRSLEAQAAAQAAISNG